ncbi:hypothetical protein [Achromobacter spanius]|uniref:Uncharacterized protein n=1 Tax=Achromobacter spanius TaxID=217203 RepID=A0A2S0I5M8_9BURK|nr:hypothetical protein [Achromobacter spanius]AVJ27350.1 hypothetical protein CLM73_09640 [Achromobacter spanius]
MADEDSLIVPLSRRAFDLYAMSLPFGPNYGDAQFITAFKLERGGAVGAVFGTPDGMFVALTMRRRVDHRFVVTSEVDCIPTLAQAVARVSEDMKLGQPAEPLKPGERRRPNLLDLDRRTPCAAFQLLAGGPIRWAAMNTVMELYLAMPKPDANFASDMQTVNFDSRLWELYLFACFREMGIEVSQDVPSPDFKLVAGPLSAYVEAVTANPTEARDGSLPALKHAPADKTERLAGDAAARFAKTLRSKIQKDYHVLRHVRGLPFALALADFHGGSTMVWSREALPTYLYGKLPVVNESENGRYAVDEPIDKLKGHDIKAGLFNEPEMRNLSAIMFSNACTMAKFNRMGVLAGLGVPGVKLRRKGILYDRTSGALEPIDFDMDVQSEEYQALWPWGEAWCVELEIYHNPGATHPFPFDLLPGATHWFECDGEVVCKTMWEHTVLASTTIILAPEEMLRWPAKVSRECT